MKKLAFLLVLIGLYVWPASGLTQPNSFLGGIHGG